MTPIRVDDGSIQDNDQFDIQEFTYS